MKQFYALIFLLLPLTLFGQSEKVFVISDTTFSEGWKNLTEDWRYQKGDDPAWASPDFDDASWSEVSAYNLNMPDGEHVLAERGEIVWFRKRIKADSSLTQTIVLNIRQLGASEIYLDGKLIHQLGKVSANQDEVIYNNPWRQILQLPLEKGKEQVLAVRYVNAQYKFPLYTNTNGDIGLSVSTLSHATSTDIVKNRRIAGFQQFDKNYHIALGIALLMFIIFISFFLVFPNEKINGYFAISNLFLSLFYAGVIWSNGYTGDQFWISFLIATCIVFSFSISLYCLYSIMEKTIDFGYKAVTFLGLIAIGCSFLYEPLILTTAWALLLLVAVIRIALKSWNKNRVASILFLSSSIIAIVFWAIIILTDIGLIQTDIGITDFYIKDYVPFAQMLNSVVLAIYLGYAFGKRSQELRLNLDRVRKLSKEKESILYSQNETLEKKVKERTRELNQSLENLKSTQAQLIQSEKMASLGELTAGIAHEIQNPLNFVNNFSELNRELVGEAIEELGKGDIEETKSILKDLGENSEKIAHHGKRADAIVKGMLEHSRANKSEKSLTNLNALAEEFLKLSYHGLRAKDKSFNADFKLDLDPNLPKVNVVASDIGRVILNLVNNGFYAVNDKAKSTPQPSEGEEGYKPLVIIKTTAAKSPSGDLGVKISVQDNGPGIPDSIKEKIFQPFFTTKPTGSGTGLGLSLSYDFVKAHGGELKVESKGEEGAIFLITLPLS
ncbi:MAG: ATP-binding protein [Algoriphagus sp.]|uniref:ATP-binding protein n=1 Tax=Algoriphagus sp. TaxID=1872435 RepID=UPI00260CE9ED|nr:ATP-binding protein [Algoriphagus sp.]MDG1277818.1 ATP-binding protein [Algoriphagus sp.]